MLITHQSTLIFDQHLCSLPPEVSIVVSFLIPKSSFFVFWFLFRPRFIWFPFWSRSINLLLKVAWLTSISRVLILIGIFFQFLLSLWLVDLPLWDIFSSYTFFPTTMIPSWFLLQELGFCTLPISFLIQTIPFEHHSFVYYFGVSCAPFSCSLFLIVWRILVPDAIGKSCMQLTCCLSPYLLLAPEVGNHHHLVCLQTGISLGIRPIVWN